jgi:hypothetical protein
VLTDLSTLALVVSPQTDAASDYNDSKLFLNLFMKLLSRSLYSCRCPIYGNVAVRFISELRSPLIGVFFPGVDDVIHFTGPGAISFKRTNIHIGDYE